MLKRMMLVALMGSLVWGADAIAGDDIGEHPSCKYCGMYRDKFAHSRMHIEYEDDSTVGTCSVHCAAVELALSIDKTPVAISVGDYNTKKLINAEDAAWVLGGSKPGVMTTRAKWAFAARGDAEAFIASQGGSLATFDDTMKAAYEDMYQDTKMIREKRKMKRAKTMKEKQ